MTEERMNEQMIIKRKYVRMKKLYMTDPASKAVIDQAYQNPEPGREEIYKDSFKKNSRTTFFNVPFGWWISIPHAKEIRDSFEELDKSEPYDNGKTFRDVDHAEVLGWREDGTVVLLLTDRKGNAICVSECKCDPAAEETIINAPFEQNINMYPD